MSDPSRTEQLAIRPQRSNPIRLFALSACGGLVLIAFGLVSVLMGFQIVQAFLLEPPRALVAAGASLGLALPYFGVVMWLDRNEPEPFHTLAAAFLWGAVMATGLSLFLNQELGEFFFALTGDGALTSRLTSSLSAPVVEETSKAAALFLIFVFFPREFDNVLDGLVYGAVVGLGFACVENFIYYMLDAPSWADMFALILVRGVITGAGTHIVFTGLAGLGLGLFRVLRRGLGRWLVPPAFLLLSVFVHFAWNTFYPWFVVIGDGDTVFDQVVLPLASLPVAVLALQVPFVALVLAVAILANRHERGLIKTFLATESEHTMSQQELDHLIPYRRRLVQTSGLLLSGRLEAWRERRERDRLLVNLAFAKWHMNREDELDEQEAIFYARRVRALRRELQGLTPS